MVELRWLTWEVVVDTVPPHIATRKKLQYRQMIDMTIRAGGAGAWDANSFAQTANYQWSEWQDVPEVAEGK